MLSSKTTDFLDFALDIISLFVPKFADRRPQTADRRPQTA